MMSIFVMPFSTLTRQTNPQAPHSFTGDSSAVNPPE
jgi:hypothetical protein